MVDSQIQQVIIIVPSSFPTVDHNLVFLLVLALVLGNSVQELFKLVLGDLLAQLARLGQHDQAVFDIRGPGFLHKANAAQTVGGFGLEDLVQDRRSTFSWQVSVMTCGGGPWWWVEYLRLACRILVNDHFSGQIAEPTFSVLPGCLRQRLDRPLVAAAAQGVPA
jgi:hypothetical protein